MSLFKSVIRKCLLFLLAPVFMLNACGFTPLYSQNADNTEIVEKLVSIRVQPIKTLMGQEYVNALEDVLDPRNIGASKEYVIEASLNKNVRPLAIESDRTVTRYKVVIIVQYTLKEEASDKVISSGKIKGEADYDRVDSDYATYISENDTTSRVIKELAQDTKIKIISALLQ